MFKYVITLTMALAMIFSASLVYAHSRGVAEAYFTDNPPVIDGDAGDPEWQERWAEFQAGDNGTGPSMHMKPETTPAWFIFDETSPNRISRGNFDGDEDWSAEYGLLFDEEWLYYVFVCKDDVVFEDLDGDDVEKGGDIIADNDQLWLIFDYEHNAPVIPKGNDDRELAGREECLFSDGDVYYRLKVFSKGLDLPGIWLSLANNPAGGGTFFDKEGTENLKTTRTADGYIYEGKLRFKEMFKGARVPNLLPPIDGVVWGWDSTIDDHDVKGFGREGAISWASSFENDNMVCGFGDLKFVGTRAVAPQDKLPTTWGNLKKKATQ
jgi:hypothetical protein